MEEDIPAEEERTNNWKSKRWMRNKKRTMSPDHSAPS
jgi:hypothetical protein